MRFRSFAIALATLCLPGIALADHDEAPQVIAEPSGIGPVLNAPAPEVTAVSADGKPASLSAITGSEGTIIAFVRSADWCPFCKKQLIELNEVEAELWASGWQVAGLSYDSPEKLAAFSAKSKITFPLFSDADSSTIKAFGLLNEDIDPDARNYGIPHPALVFIDTNGTVKAVLREEGYRDRPEIDVIRSKIQELSTTAP